MYLTSQELYCNHNRTTNITWCQVSRIQCESLGSTIITLKLIFVQEAHTIRKKVRLVMQLVTAWVIFPKILLVHGSGVNSQQLRCWLNLYKMYLNLLSHSA